MSDVIQLGPVAYRPFNLPEECQENAGHLHHYDHITVVQAGALKVFWRKDGEDVERESRVYHPGEFFLVKADTYHRIKATKPGTRYACVFTHRDHDGLVVQEYEGHLEAYDLKGSVSHV